MSARPLSAAFNALIARRARAEQGGFTLIELMIAVAVIGILAAVAYPSYTEYIKRTHRASAQAMLSELSNRQHQMFVDSRKFVSTVDALNSTIPPKLAERYTFTVASNAGPPATFTLTATPAGAQAGDACGAMTIDQAGAKTPATCW